MKSCDVEVGAPLEALTENGVLDARFVNYVSEANYVVELFNKGDVGLMRDRLLHVPVA